jgi:DCC1-like thiol-disulfide oxidoreductase
MAFASYARAAAVSSANVTAAAIFASFPSSWPRDVRSLSSSASILIAQIPLRSSRLAKPAYVKSEAALRIARELPRWQWTWVLHLIPRVIRDAIYDLVVRNRYRWFGRRDACILPIWIVRGHREHVVRHLRAGE